MRLAALLIVVALLSDRRQPAGPGADVPHFRDVTRDAGIRFARHTSPDKRFDSLYLANYGTIRLKDELARLPGVGNVQVLGSGQYSIRVWLDPEKLKARGLTTQDVTQALAQQSQQVAAGQIGAPPTEGSQPFQYTVQVAGRLADPDQFQDVIVKTGNAGEVTSISKK